MNSLAVLVSAMKNGENLKKNSEIRISVLSLPATSIFLTKLDDADAAHCLDGFKREFSTAVGVDQQLAAVKIIINKFTQEDPWVLTTEQLSQILTDLYFHAPLKHPIRNTVVKVLNKVIDKKRDIVVRSILTTITDANHSLNQLLLRDDVKISILNDFVASLIGCFENFNEAVIAIESYFLVLLQTLNRLIDLYMNILEKTVELSPGKRSEIYIFLHNAIRVVLSCVQQFQSKIDDPVILEPILNRCWMELYDNQSYADLPMDTKVNCGILKVYYDRIFGDIYRPKEKIFAQLSETLTISVANVVLVKELCYAVAIINTITEKDLADKNFGIAMETVVNRLIEIGKENTMDSSIIMAVTRALVQFSKKTLNLLRKQAAEQTACDELNLKTITQNCLNFVWLNVDHSIDCVRYLAKDLLKNLLKLGHEKPQSFGVLVDETISIAKCNETNDALVCLLLDCLCQVRSTERMLGEVSDVQRRILGNIFKDSCWAICYERLMITNGVEIQLAMWCDRWIKPLLSVDEAEWKNNFDRLKIIRNLFEKALKSKPEAAEYVLHQPNISLEIYVFVLWIMRRSGRKLYSPQNWQPSTDAKIVYAKIHPSDEIRILAFRILIECHKTSEQFPLCDLKEILEFIRFNCNCQNPSMRQQINTTMRRALSRIECGYVALTKSTQTDVNIRICKDYEKFLSDLIDFCVELCLFDGANFSRRTIGLTTLLHTIETWQKLLPNNLSIYTQRLWSRLQKTLSDSYVSNKELANGVLRLCARYYPKQTDTQYDLNELKELMTNFRPYGTMTAAHFLEFCGFSGTYFENNYEVVIWCEKILDDGLSMAFKSLLQAARYNSLYGSLLSIRHMLAQIDFMKISEQLQIKRWRAFFQRIIPKCKQLTDVVAPIVNSSAPEGHLPNDLNDISHYVANTDCVNGNQIRVTPQIMLVCAWRTVREASLLLGDIALRTPVITSELPNGLITIDQLLCIGEHFQQLLAETKHRGAFEQAFVGFSSLCLRLWRSNEPKLHSYPMRLIRKIAGGISGKTFDDDSMSTELDVSKLCATRRSAGIPFMIQALVTTETQVCSTTALTFCMTTFTELAKFGSVQETRTHSLNILRALFRCTELGEAVCDYISDGIECSIRGYSATTWPERNSSTLLFSSLMTRIFGVQRTKESENLNIKNKMTGRVFFIRYPRLYDFFLAELTSASKAIERNERPTRLHPLLLLISRLYPSALEGCDSNLKLSTYVPLISTCSSSPELVTRRLSAKSMVALIPSANVTDRMFSILKELKATKALNTIDGYLLQIIYLLRSNKHQAHHIDVNALNEFAIELTRLDFKYNSIVAKPYLEIFIEILLDHRIYPIDAHLMEQCFKIRNVILNNLVQSTQFNRLAQSYVQKTFTIFNMMLCVTQIQSEQLPIAHHTVYTTHNELLETQLNVWHLFLLQSTHIAAIDQDFSCYEMEFVDFVLGGNKKYENRLRQLLPSVDDLYFVIDHREMFYPFGTIKAYEILSILMTSPVALENYDGLRKTTIDNLLSLMVLASDEAEIDEVANAIWKFINSHLQGQSINLTAIDEKQMLNILTYVRSMSQPYKSNDLRQTATETISIINQYFAQSTITLALLIDFAELLLCVLRDDDVYVRDQASDIVLTLIHANDAVKNATNKVIPLVAEEYFLQWLDNRFVIVEKENAWHTWLDLLRLIQAASAEEIENELNATNDSNNLIDVDIFEANEANMFGETRYVSHKCYQYLIKRIENAAAKDGVAAVSLKQTISLEFPLLCNF